MPVRDILDYTIEHADGDPDQLKHAVSKRDPDADAVTDGNANLDQHTFAIPNTDTIGVANADADTLGRYHLRVDLHFQHCFGWRSVRIGPWPRRRVLSDAHGNNLNSSQHLL